MISMFLFYNYWQNCEMLLKDIIFGGVLAHVRPMSFKTYFYSFEVCTMFLINDVDNL